MDYGWVKLHRTMQTWEWSDSPMHTALFVHCLMMANHSDNNWRGVKIKSGEFITSYSGLSKKTGLSIQQVRTKLKQLKSTGELTYKTNAQHTKIIIQNWNKYQSANTVSNNQITNDQHTDNITLTTNKNEKNEKNENNNNSLFDINNIYAAYPKKQGKKIGLKKLEVKIKTLEDFDNILLAVKRYSSYVTTENIETKYIKQFSTWVNQECWNDDYGSSKEEIESEIMDFINSGGSMEM